MNAGVSESAIWGSIVAFLVQALVTFTLFAFLLVISTTHRSLRLWFLYRWRQQAVFSVGAVLALLLLPLILEHPIGYIDAIQTVVLAIIFLPLTGYFTRYLGHIEVRQRPARPVTPPVSRPEPAPNISPASDTVEPVGESDAILYQRLLRMALGDRGTVDSLIQYERRRFPHASQAKLVQRAIDRWEYDHQR